jgi:alpha-tubulin suppressor-like RCC1 family protein
MDLKEIPQAVSNPVKRTVKKAVCGEKHAFILLDNGVLLMAGSNEIGQLGLDPLTHPELEGI